jgi:hypothetical protein
MGKRDGGDPSPRGDDSEKIAAHDADSRRRWPSRRGVLKAVAGSAGVLGAARAIDNALLGYGVVVGTNLRDQDLGPLADRGFGPGGNSVPAGDLRVTASTDAIRIRDGSSYLASFDPTRIDAESARARGAEHGIGGVTAELARDVGDIAAGEHTFEFHGLGRFFDRVRNAEARFHTAGVLRRWPWSADPELVARFVDADLAKPEPVLRGLASGFREHAHYDAGRYVAGAVQDNVIFGAANLRESFREPVGFRALLADDGTGMFCYEFTNRSIEALHAVPAPEQRVPVIGARVMDTRHKHAYTAVASVVRDGGLRVPMTFVDYTHATMYDDFNARGVLGEGLEAYDDRHRATAIDWRPF